MKRKSGFYFIKRNNGWEPAYYFSSNKNWILAGFKDTFIDSDFEAIKEQPIKLPE